MKQRATELLPQVLLTLLSIIQALALELLWTRIVESDFLFAGGAAALAGWLQFSAIAIGILLIWLTYTGLVMRYAWTPRTRDSISPFAIGVLEFSLIQTAGPLHPALWLVEMAVVFGFATYVSNDIFVRASRERGDEVHLFEVPALRSRWIGLGGVGVHLAFAAGVALAGGYGIFAIVVFALVNVLLLIQTWIVHRYQFEAFAGAEAGPTIERASPVEVSE